MNEERMFILKMVAEGKITAEEADSLLRTLEEADQPKRAASSAEPQPDLVNTLKAGAEALRQQALNIKADVLRNHEQFLREQKQLIKQTINQAVSDVTRNVGNVSTRFEWRDVGGDQFLYETPKETAQVETSDKVALNLQHRHGDIELDSWAENIVHLEYEKIVRAENEETAQQIAAEIEVRIEPDETTEGRTPVRIQTIYPENRGLWQGGRRARVNYWLKAPHETDLVLKNQHGNVSVQNLRGTVELATAHGNVTVKEIGGAVNLQTQHGNVSASEVGNELKLEARHGNVSAAVIRGHVNLSGAHGNVELNNVEGSVNADRAHGNLTLEDIGGDLTLNHRHGNVEGAHVTGTLKVDKQHGRVSLDDVRRTFHIESRHAPVDVEVVEPPADECVINAQHSPVSVTMPDGAFASVAASTHHGNISSEFDGDLSKGRHDSQFQAQLGTTGAALRITGHHGNVQLRRKASAAGVEDVEVIEVEVERTEQE